MFAWLSLIACSGGTLEGRVVDGRTGQPIPDFALMAKATETTSMGCTAYSTKTDAQGMFRVEGSCNVPYALSPVKSDDVDVWFAAGDSIPKDAKGPVEVQAWRTPTAPGVYRMAGAEFEPLRTVSDVKTRDLAGTAEKVSFPAKLPERVSLLAPGEQLVLVGKDNVEGIAPVPLVANQGVIVKEGELDVTQKDWVYLGVKVTPGTPPVVEQVGARFDPAGIKSVAKGERSVSFVPAEALAPGRYALLKPGDKRVYVLDFGSAQASTGAPPAAEPAPGPADPPG
jgi:hypothetical protein